MSRVLIDGASRGRQPGRNITAQPDPPGAVQALRMAETASSVVSTALAIMRKFSNAAW